MARATAEIELLALVGEATKTIKRFAADSQKQLSSINFNTTISAINDGFQILEKTAGKAFGVVSGFVGTAITEATEGEQAITQLANSMRIVGDFTTAAIDDFSAFADEIQRTTTVSDDQALAAAAIAKQYSLTNEEAKKATRAAIDLSAATGQDLDSAVAAVGKTFSGFIDRDLGRMIPGLKNLTKEQLAAGEAAKIIADRFQGSADALGNTFQGSLSKTTNALNNFIETVGKIIISNQVLIDSIKIIGETFGSLTGEVEKNKSTLASFVNDSIKGIVSIVPIALAAVRSVDSVLSSVVNLFRAVGTGLAGVTAALSVKSFSEAKEIASATADDILKIYSGTSSRLSNFYDPLIRSAKEASDKIQKIEVIDAKGGKVVIKPDLQAFEIAANRQKQAVIEGAEAHAKKIKEAFEEQKSAVQNISKNPFEGLLQSKKPGDVKFFTDAQEKGIARAAGLITAALSGADGARELIKSAAGAVGEAIIPGLGPVVSQLTDALSKGPEFVRQQVTEFARAIPDLIKNISEAFPVLIETLAQELPPALAKTMPTVAVGFSLALVRNIPNIVRGFAQGFVDAAKQAGQALIDIIKNIPGDIFGGISGSGGGGIFEGIPVLGGFGDLLGFAEGGRVPNSPKYEGDRFPAKLNAGEQVLSKDLSSQLEAFLAGGVAGSGQPLVVNLVVGQQQLARAILDLNRGGFRTA